MWLVRFALSARCGRYEEVGKPTGKIHPSSATFVHDSYSTDAEPR